MHWVSCRKFRKAGVSTNTHNYSLLPTTGIKLYSGSMPCGSDSNRVQLVVRVRAVCLGLAVSITLAPVSAVSVYLCLCGVCAFGQVVKSVSLCCRPGDDTRLARISYVPLLEVFRGELCRKIGKNVPRRSGISIHETDRKLSENAALFLVFQSTIL